jgi:demethylmenaquinone methyltransferase/2-methoxy-6-polyprenyl-1,4-benzoquinol methylase
MCGDDLINYYARRAKEYDSIYAKPERQQHLTMLEQHLRNLLRGHDILELACGTGYWTEVLSPVASSILATDINKEVLAIAEQRTYSKDNVRFANADINDLATIQGEFSAVLAAFFWSHVQKQTLSTFLSDLHKEIAPRTLVVFIDNLYVEESSTPIAATDSEGNTYQDRVLSDGSRYRVLKNFPSAEEIRGAIGDSGVDVDIRLLTYYWCASYRAIK